MRIELPLSSWAEAQRAMDDAHTLTVPSRHPQAVPHPLLAAWPGNDATTARVDVAAMQPPCLTLTF